MPGWKCSSEGITELDKLPSEMMAYLERMSELVGAKVSIISTGPKREETIVLNPDQFWLWKYYNAGYEKMFKRIILVCLIAVIAYYAGDQGLTPGNFIDWFTENDIFQTSKEALQEIFELAEEQQVVEKAGGVIDSLKEKVTNWITIESH